MKYCLYIFTLLILLISCKDGIKNPSLDPSPLPILNTEQGRSSWQKPQEVIELLGDINDKTIVDVGAGTGYFTFRMAFKAGKVIAIDIDKDMIDLLETFRTNLPADIQDHIETRLVLPNNPMIKPQEADAAIIINTIAYIDNKVEYLSKLRQGLKPNGKLLIVDFKAVSLPIAAPPMNQRYKAELLVADLKKAGFEKVSLDESILDHQYVIISY